MTPLDRFNEWDAMCDEWEAREDDWYAETEPTTEPEYAIIMSDDWTDINWLLESFNLKGTVIA